MPERPWIFTSNTFEVNTQGSHKRMLSIATDTEAKLEAEISDADINILYTGYFPAYDAYRQIYINYDVASGAHEGETLNVENLLRTELPKELRKWEGFVRSIYPEDSPQERSIFPDKRNPFLGGTYDDRISAVGSLAARLAADPNATIQGYAPTVQSFYNLLLSARDVQQQKEGLLGSLSDTREQQRLLLANELYGVLGGLMRKFRSDPQQITRFFDLSLLRETGGEEQPAPPPPLQLFLTLTANQIPLSHLSMGIKGTASQADNCSINWGDTTTDALTLNGIYQNIAHDYLTQGIYTIEQKSSKPENITGLIGSGGPFNAYASIQLSPLLVNLEELNFSGNQFTTISIPTELSQLKIVFLVAGNLDAPSVNNLLLTINGFNTNGGTINISGGTNASPSGAGIAAKNQLLSRGWTVTTN